MAVATTPETRRAEARSTKPLGDGLRAAPWRYDFWRALFGAPYRVLKNTPVMDIDRDWPAGREMIAEFDQIRAECLALALDQDPPAFDEIAPRQKEFFDHDQKHWRMALLKVYGAEIEENLDRTPTLKRFFDRRPEVVTATISVFAPHKHVAPHDGPFRGVLRFHLGLLVEEYADGTTAGALVVDGETYYVREGGGMLWDDTFIHEAYNTSDKPRIALLLDVYRPGMPWWLRLYTNAVIWVVRQGMYLNGSRKRMKVGG